MSNYAAVDLKRPEYYINRELSLLEFNRRVLYQAVDVNTPLLERVKYLCISCTNLDEFFEVRVAGLMQKAEAGSMAGGPDNIAPADLLKQISTVAHALVQEQYRILNEVLLPQLESEGISIVESCDWNEGQRSWLKRYFLEEILPILSPIGLDPAHPFPRILNKSLSFIIALSGKDAFGRNSGLAVVQVPRTLPRLIRLPTETGDGGGYQFVYLASVIHAFVAELFPGMSILGCYQFRVTRNSDLYVDEEEVSDLKRALEGELASRRYGDTVRLEVAVNCPDDAMEYLLRLFELTPSDLYQVEGPVNLSRLMQVVELVDRPDLQFNAFTPGLPARLARAKSLFEMIANRDVLLHHPFQSFAPVVEFLQQAAEDFDVLSIKQTLYRTGPESAVVAALINAARLGKQVTVVIELRARFDEEANIALANKLQEAGVHVMYGVVGYKTHAKLIHVLRREAGGLRHYVHLGTGNYHTRTARLYTDYALFTADPRLGQDVNRVFMQLASLGRISHLDRLLQSPFTLHETLLKLIEREIVNAMAGQKARIILKVNSLVETSIIQALYRASQAGVRVNLVVRGICCLRPGVCGVSDNIEVRSIIGRFLEHTRVYYFLNDGNPEIFCSSADLMERNLFKRVEVCFPILNLPIKRRIEKELKYYLDDNQQAWRLDSGGQYTLLQPGAAKPLCAQSRLLQDLSEDNEYLPRFTQTLASSPKRPDAQPPAEDRPALADVH